MLPESRPKRNSEESIDEEHYHRYKRIRLVSRAKRLKAPKSFVVTQRRPAFHTAAGFKDKSPWRNHGDGLVSLRHESQENSTQPEFRGLAQEDTFAKARSAKNIAEDDTYNIMKLRKGRSYANSLDPVTCSRMTEQINRMVHEGDRHVNVPYLIQASLVRLSTYTDDILPDFLPAPDIGSRLLPKPLKFVCICHADDYATSDARSEAIRCEQCGNWQHHACYYPNQNAEQKHRCGQIDCPSSIWYKQIVTMHTRRTICISANPSSDLSMTALRSSAEVRDPTLKIILVLLKLINVPLDVNRWELYLRERGARPRKLNLVEMPLLEISQLESQYGHTDTSLELRRRTRLFPSFAFGTYQCQVPICARSLIGQGFLWMEELIAHELEHVLTRRTHICSLCSQDDRSYFTLEHLQRHIIARHNATDIESILA